MYSRRILMFYIVLLVKSFAIYSFPVLRV